MSKKLIDKKRLAVDLPIEIHNEIKLLAEKRHCSISYYVLSVLMRVIREERKYE